MTIIAENAQKTNETPAVRPVIDLAADRNDKTAQAKAEELGNKNAKSRDIQKVLEGLWKLTDNLYYNRDTRRPTLRTAYKLNGQYSISAGDVGDEAAQNIGAFLEQNGLSFRPDALSAGIDLAARGGDGERVVSDFQTMMNRAKTVDGRVTGTMGQLIAHMGLPDDDYTRYTLNKFMSAVYFAQTYEGAPREMPATPMNLILYGVPGAFKTRFFEALTFGHLATLESVADFKDKDFQLKAVSNWIINNDDMVATKNDSAVATFKKEITRPFYEIRRPYGRSVDVMPRRAVYGATTNKYGCIPRDTTGDRRTWVLEVQPNVTPEEARKRGAECGAWFTPETALKLWAEFLEVGLQMNPNEQPPDYIESRRAELVEAHSTEHPLETAVLETIAELFGKRDDLDPFTGATVSTERPEVPVKELHKQVLDRLYDMGERTQGRTAEITEIMKERGYTIDKHGTRTYKAPKKTTN